jgi:hypothetical protein
MVFFDSHASSSPLAAAAHHSKPLFCSRSKGVYRLITVAVVASFVARSCT